MPLTHSETFKVRHYECDAYGHLNNAVYLRYMQEAGIAAGKAAGLDDAYHNSSNRTWLPRLTHIEYLQPIGIGETLQVRTWLEGLRRVIARRNYEFQRSGDDAVAARAQTDWVFLEGQSLRPVTIPEEIARMFFPDGLDDHPLPRIAFPSPPEAPEGVFLFRRNIEWRDIDPMQHMNNAAYFNYAEECVFQQAREYGWPLDKMKAAGFHFFARQSTIQYLEAARFEDELEISTWLFDVKPARGTRHYEFVRTTDKKLIAQMQTLWVAVHPETGKPTRIPEAFLQDYQENIAKG